MNDVGSSSSTVGVSCASTIAMRTRCRCPPDKLCSERSRSSDTPASESASSMRSSSALLKRENDPQHGNLPHTTSSRAVIIGTSCCCTNTPKSALDREQPAMTHRARQRARTPDVGFTSPMASFASVDFPQPFGPTMQLMLPFGNDAEKPSNKRLLPYPEYDVVKLKIAHRPLLSANEE